MSGRYDGQLKTRRYGLFSGRVDSDGTDHFREKEPRRVTEHSHVKSRRGIYILEYESTTGGIIGNSYECRRGAVASWLVHSTPDRAVRVRDLAGDIALCS